MSEKQLALVLASDVEKPSMPDQIREAIKEELKKPKPDSLRITELANQLTDLEPDFVRFTVDASHVDRLGYELVGKQGTALAELVKNAYDADATAVLVDIQNSDENGESSISVQDDGIGMGVEEIKRAWMRISTSSKVDAPISSRFGRLRAGRKGIGRFAVQRLGKVLVLRTGQKGSSIGWKISINWDEQHVRGRDITLVPHKLEQYEKKPSVEGTTLLIKQLRDEWTPEAIKTAWRSIVLLQAPLRDVTEVSTPEKADAAGLVTSDAVQNIPQQQQIEDPGFQAFLDLRDEKGKISNSVSIDDELAKAAIAQISATIDAEGIARVEVHSSTLNLHESHILEGGEYRRLGPVRLESEYFIFVAELFSELKMKAAQALLRDNGGIRVYRNGFRVPPYGDESDDWLKFAADSARRAVLVPYNNFNFLGRVYITSAENPLLEETSSREGLIENEQYALLVRFIRHSLIWAIKRVGWARDRKIMAKDTRKKVIDENVAEQVSRLIQKLKHLGDSKDADTVAAEIISLVTEYEKTVRLAQEGSIRYEEMLRVLASLGLSISVFAHEVRAASSFADDSMQIFLRRAKELDLLAKESDLEPLVNKIAKSVDKITVLGDYLGGLTAFAGTRKLGTVPLVGVLKDFDERLGIYLSGQGVNLKLKLNDSPLRTCPVHRSEIDSVLFNLVSNSLKSIKKQKPDSGVIQIEASRDGKFVVLVVSDNGTGIDPSIEDKIFDAFFTTTGDEEEGAPGSGAGLGLKIVSDIASTYGGSVRVVPHGSDMKSAMEFRILGYDPKTHSL